jgi:hypothetical protein
MDVPDVYRIWFLSNILLRIAHISGISSLSISLYNSARIFLDQFMMMTLSTAAIDRTNTFYGGLDIEVSNVVFVHGSIDPWHALGITKTVDQGAPAIYIEGKKVRL